MAIKKWRGKEKKRRKNTLSINLHTKNESNKVQLDVCVVVGAAAAAFLSCS
jgi:hypothetical protein